MSAASHLTVLIREYANRAPGVLRAMHVEHLLDLEQVPAVTGNRTDLSDVYCALHVGAVRPMLGLWLDDHRTPPHYGHVTWDHVDNIQDFADALNKRQYDVVSFDHDLHRSHTMWYFENGGHQSPPDPGRINFNPPNGYDCAKHLVALQKARGAELPVCVVHSHNPYGARNIARVLLEYSLERAYPARILVARAESAAI